MEFHGKVTVDTNIEELINQLKKVKEKCNELHEEFYKFEELVKLPSLNIEKISDETNDNT